jgi:hypothetical protein
MVVAACSVGSSSEAIRDSRRRALVRYVGRPASCRIPRSFFSCETGTNPRSAFSEPIVTVLVVDDAMRARFRAGNVGEDDLDLVDAWLASDEGRAAVAELFAAQYRRAVADLRRRGVIGDGFVPTARGRDFSWRPQAHGRGRA